MRLSLTGLLVLLLLASDTPPDAVPSLRVRPQLGLAPLTVTAWTRLAVPLEADRELDIALVEGTVVLRRSVRDIFWQPTLRPASTAFYQRTKPAIHNLQPGIGHMYQAVPQGHRATWEIATRGSYTVIACVWPGGRCVRQAVVVK